MLSHAKPWPRTSEDKALLPVGSDAVPEIPGWGHGATSVLHEDSKSGVYQYVGVHPGVLVPRTAVGGVLPFAAAQEGAGDQPHAPDGVLRHSKWLPYLSTTRTRPPISRRIYGRYDYQGKS